MRLDEFLIDHQVPFKRLHHAPAYTANHVAQLLQVPGREMAKTVLVRTSEGYVLTVLPATHRIDLERLREDLQEVDVDLASEAEMERIFSDCERGAMPPFGSLYHVQTLVEESLAEDEEIVFEGQDHEQAIRMAFRDYVAVECPRRGQFACQG